MTSLMAKLTGQKWWMDLNVIKRLPYCSYLWATWFERYGYDFGVKAKRATPDDMLDFCQANPDKWKCIRPWAEV